MAPQRREILGWALGGALAAAGSRAGLGEAWAEPLAKPVPFAADTVLKAATALAASAYRMPDAPLPSQFSGLTFEQYATIGRKPGTAIWASDKVGFSLEPLHRGFVYTTPIVINIVENGMAQRLIYDPADYDFGKLQPPTGSGDLGFSGLRILAASDEGFQDVALFQGASFYRSRARGQNFGVTARGLAVRTGDDPGEEFPLFREFWVEKPSPASNTLTIHALLDSQSVTGAYRFTIRSLETTIIDTEMTLIGRAATDKLGVGAMAAGYLFSGLDHRRPSDWREAVYEIAGLQMQAGNGEWLWRPVVNRETLQISAFSDTNPRGFGLMQRSRTFDDFFDDVGRWELRPSLWIEPIGDWSEGDMRLLEIPVTTENNANILAQWRPKAGVTAGGTLSLAYRQFWCWTPPTKPPLALCTHSRAGKIGGKPRFTVEMAGDVFADPQRAAAAVADLHASNGKISFVQCFPFKDRRSVRVMFDLDPGSESFSELRLTLNLDNQAVSETWLYRWTA
ncbi:glucans biosynthesis protein [Roseiarcus fermentans]|uniref:Glucans biosynthesis protein n=1 Tax=Roseiarcus fermentans TaxID=1473586 RepID=A0A366FQU7_9HYPH|nr:glucan biosynthesis protein D [Roseiarcus fermentans]RBP16921.1 glucans biosynthesis protein [Roseiarcus fermentans]